MDTFARKIIAFNESLEFHDTLPDGIHIMNPFREDKNILPVSSAFYRKFYSDHRPRHIILGINPGRFGAGVTGIPFTDTKRLKNECGLPYTGRETHEPSAVFVYDVIAAYGGTRKFYSDFYINSVCPLGFTRVDKNGKETNYNYYDSKALTDTVRPFVVKTIQDQIGFGISADIAFCFGNGKNEKFLRSLNDQHGFFKEIVALEHPRFVMQYKARMKQFYIDKYLAAFSKIQ